MKVLRFMLEAVLFIALATAMILGMIAATRWIVDDVKVQYLMIGYYLAIHRDVVLWIWKKTGIEKTPPA